MCRTLPLYWVMSWARIARSSTKSQLASSPMVTNIVPSEANTRLSAAWPYHSWLMQVGSVSDAHPAVLTLPRIVTIDAGEAVSPVTVTLTSRLVTGPVSWGFEPGGTCG